MTKLNKVARYKIDSRKSLILLSTNNDQSEKQKPRK